MSEERAYGTGERQRSFKIPHYNRTISLLNDRDPSITRNLIKRIATPENTVPVQIKLKQQEFYVEQVQIRDMNLQSPVISKNIQRTSAQNEPIKEVQFKRVSLKASAILSGPNTFIQPYKELTQQKPHKTSQKLSCFCKKYCHLPIWLWILFLVIIIFLCVSCIVGLKKYTKVLGCPFGTHNYKNQCLACPIASNWNGKYCKVDKQQLAKMNVIGHEQLRMKHFSANTTERTSGCLKGFFFFNGKCIECPNDSIWNGVNCLRQS